MDNNILFGWVFHKDLEGNWCTAKREYYYELFNGEKGNVLKSKDVKVLEELISKTGGNKAEIEKLLNAQKTNSANLASFDALKKSTSGNKG